MLFRGSVSTFTSASSSRFSKAATTGALPTNSGMRPKSTRSFCSTYSRIFLIFVALLPAFKPLRIAISLWLGQSGVFPSSIKLGSILWESVDERERTAAVKPIDFLASRSKMMFWRLLKAPHNIKRILLVSLFIYKKCIQ